MASLGNAISLGATIIGCVAAIVVVPEVRRWARLDEGPAAVQSTWELPRVSLSAPLHFSPTQDPRIGRIREMYQRIEGNEPRSEQATQPISWPGADSANTTAYRHDGEIPKIRIRIYRGEKLESLLFYYAGDELTFVHRVDKIAGVPSPRGNLREDRFYFQGNRMIRWLAPGRVVVPESLPEFGRSSEQLSRLGAEIRSVVLSGM